MGSGTGEVSRGDPTAGTTRASSCLILGVAAVAGAIYGGMVAPRDHQMIQTGSLMAGLVPYSSANALAEQHAHEPTLMTSLPALLLASGWGAHGLAVMTCSLVCAGAFAALAAAALALGAGPLLGVLVPLRFLGYIYPDAHFYPVSYPIRHEIFGQVGQYTTLLTLGLLALGYEGLAGFLLGILPPLHPPWALGAWIGAGAVLLAGRQRPSRRLVGGFACGMLLGVGLMVAGTNLEASVVAAPQAIPAEWPEPPKAAAGESTASRATPEARSGARGAGPEDHQATEVRWRSHARLLHREPEPWLATFAFLRPTLSVALLGFLLVWSAPGEASESRRRLLVALGAVSFTALGYKFLEEWDPHFEWLGAISPVLPTALVRAIIQRWLNLMTLAGPVLGLVLLARLAQRTRHPALAVLLAAGLKFPELWLPLGLLGAAGGGSLSRAAGGGGHGEEVREGSRPWARWVLGAFLLIFALRLVRGALDPPVRGDPAGFSAIAEAAREGTGDIILGFGVMNFGDWGFNPDVATARASYVPGQILVPGVEGAGLLQVYCFDPSFPSFLDFADAIEGCFEERPRAEWSWVGYFLGATSVMVPQDHELQLPLVLEAGGLRLYDIPPLTPEAVQRLRAARLSE